MKSHWIIFFVLISAGIVLTAVYSTRQTPPSDIPTRIPGRDEIVPPGVWSHDIIRTNDEAQIPALMRPTPVILSSAARILTIGCAHGTDLCKLQVTYDFVRTNYETQSRGSLTDHIRSPTEVLLFGEGNKLELSLFLASLQRAEGFSPEVIRGAQSTFVRVRINNESIIMDPSCAGCAVMDAHVKLRGDELIFSAPD